VDRNSIDVFSHEVYLDDIPYETFAWLRENEPVFYQEIPDPDQEPAAWALTRYQDVLDVSKNATDFTVSQTISLNRVKTKDVSVNLLNVDDPLHLDLRRMTNKGFTPKVVRRYEEHYRQLSADLLDKALPLGTFDFVTEVSMPLPLLAICELIGAPHEDHGQIARWSNGVIAAADPEYASSADSVIGTMQEMFAYIDTLADARRREPRDDIMTSLTEAFDRGELSVEEFHGYIFLLFVAGNETTRNNISHGLDHLIRNPSQMALLRSDVDAHIDGTIDEITRIASPVIYMARSAVNDVRIGDKDIPAGSRVAMFYCSANRDRDAFGPTADEFDITRSPNDHLSFGFGAHFCLGVHLAKLETKVMFQELLKRTKDIQLAGKIERMRSSFVHGVKHLPVSVVPA
jgi:cholest-4-en-3-one 26-monooxygenase